MATEDHIHLDGTEYAVLRDGYAPFFLKGERNTLTSTGKDDTVFPANPQQGWDMVLKVTKTKLDSLLTTWAKKAGISFTDHLGGNHTVICLGAIEQRTLVPILDGASSLYHVPIRMKVKVS